MSSDCHPVRPLRLSHVTALGVTKLSDADGLRHQVSVPDRNQALRCLEVAALPERRGERSPPTDGRRGERASLLEAAVADAYTRLLQPAMVREP